MAPTDVDENVPAALFAPCNFAIVRSHALEDEAAQKVKYPGRALTCTDTELAARVVDTIRGRNCHC